MTAVVLLSIGVLSGWLVLLALVVWLAFRSQFVAFHQGACDCPRCAS